MRCGRKKDGTDKKNRRYNQAVIEEEFMIFVHIFIIQPYLSKVYQILGNFLYSRFYESELLRHCRVSQIENFFQILAIDHYLFGIYSKCCKDFQLDV